MADMTCPLFSATLGVAAATRGTCSHRVTQAPRYWSPDALLAAPADPLVLPRPRQSLAGAPVSLSDRDKLFQLGVSQARPSRGEPQADPAWRFKGRSTHRRASAAKCTTGAAGPRGSGSGAPRCTASSYVPPQCTPSRPRGRQDGSGADGAGATRAPCWPPSCCHVHDAGAAGDPSGDPLVDPSVSSCPPCSRRTGHRRVVQQKGGHSAICCVPRPVSTYHRIDYNETIRVYGTAQGFCFLGREKKPRMEYS